MRFNNPNSGYGSSVMVMYWMMWQWLWYCDGMVMMQSCWSNGGMTMQSCHDVVIGSVGDVMVLQLQKIGE